MKLKIACLVFFLAVFIAGNCQAKIDLTTEHSRDELRLLVAPLTLEQLTAEADEWLGIVQRQMEEIALLKVTALSATGKEFDAIEQKIAGLTEERSRTLAKASLILDSMELKGGDPKVIDGYRNYVTGALAEELQATDLRTTLNSMIGWITSSEGGIGLVLKGAGVLVMLLVLWLLAGLVRRLAALGIRRIGNLSQLLQEFLLKLIFWLVFAVGLMVALAMFGINITPLFAVLGGASFILAFAMQETLGNLAAGVMILVNKPFDVGDLVDTNGILGKVESVSIVSTTVRTPDNQVVILPNSAVWSSIITNITVSDTRRVDLVFGIGYSDDMEAASQILQRLVAEHPKILDDPQPTIKVHELADSSVNLICRPWVKTADYWDVYWDLTRQAKEQFDSSGVSIPFPQRDVHLYQQTAESS